MAYVNQQYNISTLVVTKVDAPSDDVVNGVRLVKRPSFSANSVSWTALESPDVDNSTKLVSAAISRDTISTYVADDPNEMYITSIASDGMEAWADCIPKVFVYGTPRTFLSGGDSDIYGSVIITGDSGTIFQMYADVVVQYTDFMSVWSHTGQNAGYVTGTSEWECYGDLHCYGFSDSMGTAQIDVNSQVEYLGFGDHHCEAIVDGVTAISSDGASLSITGAEIVAECHITRQCYGDIEGCCDVYGDSIVTSMSEISCDVECVVECESNIVCSPETAGVVQSTIECLPTRYAYNTGETLGNALISTYSVVMKSSGSDTVAGGLSIVASGVTSDGAALMLSPAQMKAMPFVVRQGVGDVIGHSIVTDDSNRVILVQSTINVSCECSALPLTPLIPILRGFASAVCDVTVNRHTSCDNNVSSTVNSEVPLMVSPGHSDVIGSCLVEGVGESRTTGIRGDFIAGGVVIGAASSHSYGWDTHVNAAVVTADPNIIYEYDDVGDINATALSSITPTRVQFSSIDVEAGGLSIVASGVTSDGAALMLSPASVTANAGVLFDVNTRIIGTSLSDIAGTCTNDASATVTSSTTFDVDPTMVFSVNVTVSVDAATIVAASRHVVGVGVHITEGALSANGINVQMSEGECFGSCSIETWPVINANWDHYGRDYADVTVISMGVSVSGGSAILTANPV